MVPKKDHVDSFNFWEAFLRVSDDLGSRLRAEDLRGVFQEVEKMLNESGHRFAFELTEEEGLAVLVLTPEGDPLAASEIDRLMESRPNIPGWRVYGRRQRKELEDALTFVRHIYGVDISDARFKVEPLADGYSVTMSTSVTQDFSNEESSGLVANFLDHALGEEVVMSLVRRIVVEESTTEEELLSAEDLVRRMVGN